MWQLNGQLIARLARNIDLVARNESNGLLIHSSSTKAWLEADDQAIAQTIVRLNKLRKEKLSHLASLEAKLGNAKYLASAPAKIVGETRTLHDETVASLAKLEAQLKKLS
jgi:valyl-tRNA synthetase